MSYEASFDPVGILRTLTDRGVRFVVIGGLAARAHGSPSVTGDADVCYARDDDNLRRLAGALQFLNAKLRGAGADVPFRLDAPTLKAGDHFTFSTSLGPLDCLGIPAGSAGFDELQETAVPLNIEGSTVLVASLDLLMKMKAAAGRAKDRAELEILGALREELEGGGKSNEIA